MTILFFILIALASVILGFIVLVQNPKGGGLSGTIGGVGNQFMGVKQTTDVLEKGTWIFAAVIGVLCLFSTFFFKGATASSGIDPTMLQNVNGAKAAPATQQTAPATTAPAADSNKK